MKVQFQYRLHFKYKDLILALLSPYDFVAGILDASIRGWNRHESDLIHIICTATNSEMIDIKVAYGISMLNKICIKMLGIIVIYFFYRLTILVLSRI